MYQENQWSVNVTVLLVFLDYYFIIFHCYKYWNILAEIKILIQEGIIEKIHMSMATMGR